MTPNRRGSHTRTGATRALLTPGLLGRMMNLSAGELSTRTETRIGLVGNHDLVHQSFVVFTTEHGVGSFVLNLFVQDIQFHCFAPYAFTAGRTTTLPPLAPGTAPRTNRS